MLKSIRILVVTVISAIMLSLTRSQSEVRQLDEFYTDPEYMELFFKTDIICTTVNCPLPNACADSSTCRCADGYANYFQKDDQQYAETGPYCGYIRKKQLTAFLLQFFVFSGAGQFYVGNFQYAIPQLIISLAPCVITCIQICCGIGFKSDGNRPCGHLMVLILNCTFACAFCAWWLADAIIFGMNKYTDGNGIPLNPW